MTTDKARELAQQIETSVVALAADTDAARRSDIFRGCPGPWPIAISAETGRAGREGRFLRTYKKVGRFQQFRGALPRDGLERT